MTCLGTGRSGVQRELHGHQTQRCRHRLDVDSARHHRVGATDAHNRHACEPVAQKGIVNGCIGDKQAQQWRRHGAASITGLASLMTV